MINNIVFNGRNPGLDIIKGVAIWLVVLGHGIQYVGSGNFWVNPFFSFFYSFHMPLFMLLSGYLFFQTVSGKSPVEILTGKFKSLIYPVLSWRTSTFIIIYFFNFSFYNDWNIKGYVGFYVNSYWFLWALFFCVTVVTLVRFFLNDKIRYYVIIGMILTLYWPSPFSSWVFMYPYFVTGYLIHRNQEELLERMSKLNMHFIWISLVCIYLVLMLFWDRKYLIYITRTNILGSIYGWEQLWIDSYRWITGFIGSFLCCKFIFWMIKGRSLTGWLGRLLLVSGRYSLGIYLTNEFFMMCVYPAPARPWYLFYGCILVQSLVIMFLCLGISSLLHRFRWLSVWFLGGR